MRRGLSGSELNKIDRQADEAFVEAELDLLVEWLDGLAKTYSPQKSHSPTLVTSRPAAAPRLQGMVRSQRAR
jgi:hypothetical protein